MLAACYPKALAYVLRWEGGYSNHPRDPGGPTKYGITIHDVRKYVKRNATAADVRALSLGQARHIYKTKYWDRVSGDRLPSGLDYAVFDYGVNSGIGRSNRILRRLVGLPTNSIAIDASVIAAVNKRDPDKLIDALVTEREGFLRRLRTFPTFGRGWMNRTRGVRKEAHAMYRDFKAGKPVEEPKRLPVPRPSDAPMGQGKVSLPEPGKKTAGGSVAAGGGVLASAWDWVQAHPPATVLIILGCTAAMMASIYGIRAISRHLNERVPADLEPVPELAASRPRRKRKAAKASTTRRRKTDKQAMEG